VCQPRPLLKQNVQCGVSRDDAVVGAGHRLCLETMSCSTERFCFVKKVEALPADLCTSG
jgi:hypothetical protein